jgi:hypothetical protein
MLKSESDMYYQEHGLLKDRIEAPLSISERLIRIFLMVGFVLVLAIEAWLLWQVWHLIA